MTNPVAELEDDVLRKVLNLGASFAAVQIAADVLEKSTFDDEDAEVLGWLPIQMRAHTTARFIEATEALREELRLIDATLLLIHGAKES